MTAGHIKNPLTVIAIFAGVTEVGGTFVLPHITDVYNQRLYIFFLTIFPAYLITLFFMMLWKKHTHLYAPSDYSNENNFVAAAGTQVFAKIEEEIAEESSVASSENDAEPPTPNENASTSHQADEGDTEHRLVTYLNAEDLAFKRLESELGTKFARRISPGDMRDVVFDGARTREDGGLDVVEVKLTRHPYYNSILTMRTLKLTNSFYSTLPVQARASFRFLLVIVFDGVDEDGRHRYLQAVKKDLDRQPFESVLRGYDLALLDRPRRAGEQGSLF